MQPALSTALSVLFLDTCINVIILVHASDSVGLIAWSEKRGLGALKIVVAAGISIPRFSLLCLCARTTASLAQNKLYEVWG